MKEPIIRNQNAAAKTLLKESISLLAFNTVFQKHETLSVEDLKEKVKNSKNIKNKKLISEDYYASAIKQVEAFQKEFNASSGTYITFYYQNDNIILKSFLNKAKSFLGSSFKKDNWNPADIWGIKNNKKSEILTNIKKCASLDELNKCIRNYMEEKSLFPVSLKHITSKTGKLEKIFTPEENVEVKFLGFFVGVNDYYLKIKVSGDLIIKGENNLLIRLGDKSSSSTASINLETFVGKDVGFGKSSNTSKGSIDRSKIPSLKNNETTILPNFQSFFKAIDKLDIKVWKWNVLKDEPIDFLEKYNSKKERVEVFYKKLEESKKLNRNIKLLQEALKLQKLFTESSKQAEERRLDFYKLIYKAHNEQSDYFLIS